MENTLSRFVNAQELDYDTAYGEIANGKKSGHWMWYIFPQLKGLGKSATSDFYGISGIEEARDSWKNYNGEPCEQTLKLLSNK